MEAALSEEAAEGMKLDVGGSVLVGTGGNVTRLTIVGIVSSPEINGWSATVATSQLPIPGVGGLYVPTALAETLTGEKARISFIGVGLRQGTDLTEFRFGWSPALSALSTPSQFQEAHDIEEALDESASAENLKLQAQTATVVSMLAALFIIFSTLSMGVTERVRQFAILRAVALTRAQVGMLIGIEGFIFGTVGFLGGWGAGWLLMEIANRSAPELLEDGAVVGKYSILLAACCAYGGALLASLVPAIRAMRVRPVDAMIPRSAAADPHVSWKSLVTGLALLAIYPIISHGMRHGDEAPVVIYMFLGVASLAAGFILLTPVAVLLVDRIGSPLVARLTGVPVKLLASQISGSLGRTVATSIALSIGLGLYIGIQVWGHTMLSGFLPGTWAPDAVIGFRPGGLVKEDAEKVAQFKGVTKSLPIIVEQPRLRKDLTRSAARATVVRQDNVVLVGIDPRKAFGGDDPLFKFEWVEGDAEDAVKMLESGRACIVPDHFLRETGLRVGDSFELMPPGNPEKPVS
ncbi:MAG: ABC transporter permease, partial [Verrucomicrobiaceae bacterium]